jgi:hypothetical protein
MAGKLVLQIYEGEAQIPLRLTDIGNLLARIKDEEIHATANKSLDLYETRLPRCCDNKEHVHYKKNIGGGICFAKKYKRLNLLSDQVCGSCQSNVITRTLNYIFSEYYDGKYIAEWRRTKTTIRSKPVRGDTNGTATRAEVVEILSAIPASKSEEKKRRGRQKGSKNKPKLDQSAVTKTIKPKEPPTKPKGRLKGSKNKIKKEKATAVVTTVQSKKGRGRPKGSKNKIKEMIKEAA